MVQKGWHFSQRRDSSSSQRTSIVEERGNGRTRYSKSCETKFGIKANKYWFSDNQLYRDIVLESGFSLGVAEKREILLSPIKMRGTWWRSWLRHCARSRKVTGAIGIIHWHILSAALWPCNRNEYQEYFLAGKGYRCVGLTTPSYVD